MAEKETAVETSGSGIPPCSLVLHSPYMTDAQDHYVGGVVDPLLIQCTYAAELENKVPPVSDRYLSFTDRTDLYWQPGVQPDPALTIEWPTGHHVHNLRHKHHSGYVGGVTTGQKSCDENDIGSADDCCAPHHGHELSLHDADLVADEETDPEFYEPLHYEVSAYYVDPVEGQEASVPAGMIVFTHEDAPEPYDGWQRMDKKALRRDPRETDPHYAPRNWWVELLRIVGCLPSKYRKG